MEISEIIDSINFTTLFILFIGLKFTIETYLKYRNINSIKQNKGRVPERFENIVNSEEYKKSTDYNLDRLKFQILVSFVSIIILLLLTLGGLLSWLTEVVLGITSSNILGAILLGFFIIIISEILEIPLAIYSTFVTDIFKNLIISSVISCSIYAVVIGIIENLGSNWWIFAFVAVFSIQLIIFFLYPVLIMPLFNKFEPLDDEQFKKPIEKLLEKVKFKAKGLFVMNASLRSSHGNAFFTGFGNNKRIVFYDTLLETITPDEMEAILGHELGHYKLGHIRKSLISS